MIARLRGTLMEKSPTEITVDVNGVGYLLSIPVSTFEALGDTESTVTLLTYLHVREDSMQLFGFATEQERQMFRLLLSVSGVGPKVAQGILSGSSVEELRTHIRGNNQQALVSIPGVGRKLAERLVVELRDKVAKATEAPSSPRVLGVDGEALMALVSLGYSRQVAEKALATALAETKGKQSSVEELVKLALRHATR